MSDSPQGDRTEAPTQKRRQEAAKKGQVARSPEVMVAALLFASAGEIGAFLAAGILVTFLISLVIIWMFSPD